MRCFASLALCLALVSALVGVARAEEEVPGALSRGANAWGLCGTYQVGAPTCPTGYTVAATGGYGWTSMQGSHHRGIGQLGFGAVPLPWLAFSLELDGRIDVHPDDDQGSDVTGTGDPWLRVRAGRALGRGLSLGGEVGVWLPGNSAPSFELSATTVDLRSLLGFRRARFQLLAMLGVRIDQSANAAPERDRLRTGDRIALGLSDAHALLWGLSVQYAVLPSLGVFAELSAQWLLGDAAPALAESPLRAALGVRFFVLELLQLELSVVPSLSRRPPIGVDDPLVPIEPRLSALAGLRYTFGAARPPPSPPPPPAEMLEPTQEPEALVELSGVLTTPAGSPLPDATVTLRTASGELLTITDAEGRYSFAQLTPQRAELRADAAGFKSDHWEVEIQRPATLLPPRSLEPGASTGVLRCLVRSFESSALRAEVSVRDQAGQRIASGQTDATGTLELALPPGQYRVMIEAGGYRSQRTNVQVAANEVAILNVDMRKVE